MSVVDDSFDHPLKNEESAVMSLAGGLMGYGYQCGMLWGAALAAGAQAYRIYGTGPQAETEAVIAAQRLVEAFRTHTRHINCAEITEMNWKESTKGTMTRYLLKGGPVLCFSMSASYARIAFDEINTTMAEKHVEEPCAPASCAAELARRMGVSDMHAVMAAGFAGGIGLSGGACGALGAAIWITGMSDGQAGDLKTLYGNPKALAAIDRYLESADYEFECFNIVGKKFEHAAEHAAYLRGGGCSKIIEALAAPG